MKYIVLIHRENNSYWGECPEFPGCFSQGETTEELMENMREAVELYLDESNASRVRAGGRGSVLFMPAYVKDGMTRLGFVEALQDEDDEPLTEDELTALAQVKEDIAAGRMDNFCTLEEFNREMDALDALS
jgi:predicted RNase H-like HicB family nuclease